MEIFKVKDIGRFSFYQNFSDFGLRVGINGDNNLLNQPIFYFQIGFWSVEIRLSKSK